MIVVGVDPSSKKLAFVTTVEDGPPEAFTHVMKQKDLYARAAEAYEVTYQWALELFDNADPLMEIHVFIEEPVVGRGGVYSTLAQSKVHGAIAAAFVNSGVCDSVRGTNNSTAKKKVVGKGNASKPEIKAWAKQYWKQLYIVADDGKDQDVIDAGMHNRYGVAVLGVMERLRRHRRVMKRIKRKMR